MRKLALALLVTAAAGCAEEDDPSLPCDISSRACQRSVFRATAETRGQSDARLPRVRVISREQLAAELRASVEHQSDERDPDQLRAEEQGQRALSLLGLLPPPAKQTTGEAYVEQSVATIAAYYSHGSRDVTVIADQTEQKDDATITLSHEFVHALQDQRDGLSGLRQRYVQTTDDDVALTSMVEGEATWLSYATYFREVRQQAVEDVDYPRLFGRMLADTLHQVEVSGAPLIDATELLPYPLGGFRIATLDVEDGPESIRELFGAPPLALRWWIEDAPSGLPFMLECDLPLPAEGYEFLGADRLGFGGLLAYRSAQGESGMDAYLAAEHWRADQIGSYGSLSDGQAAAVVWRVLLDSESAALELASLAGESGEVTATVQGQAVVLSAATDPALLESWRPDEACPREKGRTSSQHSALAAIKRRLGLFR
jgi:hypothetical protein